MDRRPVNILFAEDNSAHAKLVLRTLSQHEIANDTIHVSDGEAALEYLHQRGPFADERKSPRPDVILLDLRLPKRDGMEVLREIKGSQDLASIPVVILTTSAAEKDVAAAYNLHANSYIVKPLDYEQFTQLINALGFYWLAWNRSPNK